MNGQDYDRELLVVVMLICVAFSAALGWSEATPSVAKAIPTPPTHLEQPAPVRIVGTPFVPNTNPGVR